MLKAAFHIHSTYSDGELTLSQLRDIFVAVGCSFVCTSDHAEAFDENKIERYRAECEALSGPTFRIIPGLEFECHQRMHILGLGVLTLFDSKNPEEVIKGIDSEGGISIIAHPKNTMFEQIELFRVLPCGIEVWNSKYDGRYAPRPETFRLLTRLQRRKPELLGFYGQDLHWKRQYHGLFNWVSMAVPDREGVISSLRCGRYHADDGNIQLPSSGQVPDNVLVKFERIHRRSVQLRRCFRAAKSATDRVGIDVPASIKSQLRRIF